MKTRVEEYIPKAIIAVRECITEGKDEIAKEFNGYISSFGAAIIQSGLIPAVAFYSSKKQEEKDKKEKDGEDKDRRNLMKAIYAIVYYDDIDDVDDDCEKIQGDELLKKLMEIKDDKNRFYNEKEKIMDAATALKLAIRTFKLV